jgi:hypothetical protein
VDAASKNLVSNLKMCKTKQRSKKKQTMSFVLVCGLTLMLVNVVSADFQFCNDASEADKAKNKGQKCESEKVKTEIWRYFDFLFFVF